MKTLDLNKTKKQYFAVILPDKEQTKLNIKTPNKQMMDEITELQKILTECEEDEAIEPLYEICSKIMSKNKEYKTITCKMLYDCLELEDLTLFLTSYLEFINEVAQTKN